MSLLVSNVITFESIIFNGLFMFLGHCNRADVLNLEKVVRGMKITDKSVTYMIVGHVYLVNKPIVETVNPISEQLNPYN